MNVNSTNTIPDIILIRQLLKEIIKTFITEVDYAIQISSIIKYKTLIRHNINKAFKQTNIKNRDILVNCTNHIFNKTIRGFLFPQTGIKIILELVQILELTYIEPLHILPTSYV